MGGSSLHFPSLVAVWSVTFTLVRGFWSLYLYKRVHTLSMLWVLRTTLHWLGGKNRPTSSVWSSHLSPTGSNRHNSKVTKCLWKCGTEVIARNFLSGSWTIGTRGGYAYIPYLAPNYTPCLTTPPFTFPNALLFPKPMETSASIHFCLMLGGANVSICDPRHWVIKSPYLGTEFSMVSNDSLPVEYWRCWENDTIAPRSWWWTSRTWTSCCISVL